MKSIVNTNEVIMFLINGLIATAVHFSILYFCINFLMLNYDGISNFIGAFFGTVSSFVGNRVFVFKKSTGNIFMQSSKFFMLYAIIAINHGLFLYYWSDISGHNYIIGFVLITLMNTILSYFCNKYKVFN